MGVRFSRAGRAVALLACVTSTTPSLAQSAPAGATAAAPDAKERAKQHFERARALYRSGAYREALVELDAARALDPAAKELVYNIAVIHEKLGEIAEAISYLQHYLTMGLTPAEDSKARAYLQRLQGAQREVRTETTAPAPAPSAPPSAGPASGDESGADAPSASTGKPETAAPSPPHGRIDAATVAAFVVALGAIGTGTVLGLKAMSDRPTNFVTGQSGTFASFQSRNDQAHQEAIFADVSFGVGALATVLAAYLYFGRTAQPAPATSVSALVGPRTGGLVLGGSF